MSIRKPVSLQLCPKGCLSASIDMVLLIAHQHPCIQQSWFSCNINTEVLLQTVL